MFLYVLAWNLDGEVGSLEYMRTKESRQGVSLLLLNMEQDNKVLQKWKETRMG